MANDPSLSRRWIEDHLRLLAQLADSGAQLRLITTLPDPQTDPMPIPPVAPGWTLTEESPGPRSAEVCWIWDGDSVGLGVYDGQWIAIWSTDPRQTGRSTRAWALLKPPDPPA